MPLRFGSRPRPERPRASASNPIGAHRNTPNRHPVQDGKADRSNGDQSLSLIFSAPIRCHRLRLVRGDAATCCQHLQDYPRHLPPIGDHALPARGRCTMNAPSLGGVARAVLQLTLSATHGRGAQFGSPASGAGWPRSAGVSGMAHGIPASRNMSATARAALLCSQPARDQGPEAQVQETHGRSSRWPSGAYAGACGTRVGG